MMLVSDGDSKAPSDKLRSSLRSRESSDSGFRVSALLQNEQFPTSNAWSIKWREWGCSCQVEIPKFHLTSWGVACVHEEIAIADDVPLGYYECPIYKANYTYKNTIISEVEQFIRLPLICNIPSSLFRNKNYKKEIV